MTSISPLRKAFRQMRLLGLRRSDYSKAELFGALAALGADLDFDALDRFLKFPMHWKSATAKKERDEIAGLRRFAQRAYDAGLLELALMTAALISCKAKFIGWRVAVDPTMKARKKGSSNLLAGRRPDKPAPDRIREVRTQSSSDKDAARKLGVSVKTVTRYKKKKT